MDFILKHNCYRRQCATKAWVTGTHSPCLFPVGLSSDNSLENVQELNFRPTYLYEILRRIFPEILTLKILLKIRNQRPRKPPIKNFHPNQAHVDILILPIGTTIFNSKILSEDS